MFSPTVEDVQAVFHRYWLAVDRAGVDASGYRLIAGSKSNGIAWRVMRRDAVSGALSEPFAISTGFLGWTKRDAFNTLHTVAFALEDAERAGGER